MAVAFLLLCVAAHGLSVARRAPLRRAITMGMRVEDRTVVVTGLGCVTAVGVGHEDLWQRVLAGETGVTKVTCFDDVERFQSHVGAQINGFDAKAWFSTPKTANANDRYTHLAMAAARMATEDAGLVVGEGVDGDRVGVMIGSAFGGIATVEAEMQRMQDRGPKKGLTFRDPGHARQLCVRRGGHRARLPRAELWRRLGVRGGHARHRRGDARRAARRRGRGRLRRGRGGHDAAHVWGVWGDESHVHRVQRRPHARLEAIRRRPRRLRHGRGRGHNRHRVAGPRATKGGQNLRRARGVRRDVRRAPHHDAGARRRRSRKVFDRGARVVGHRIDGSRLRQRARDFDELQRQVRDRRPEDGLRRTRGAAARLVDQGRDGAHFGRRGRD
mmetsp:Transcript_31965/g.107622  ORF Transcript_31965/g.107622 Transcript_31965/m.107622 type:complete len:386 (-) Transcript_31965:483-1640(-)